MIGNNEFSAFSIMNGDMASMDEMYSNYVKRERNKMKWISVKERLPDIGNDNALSFLCQTDIDIKVLDYITVENGMGKFYMDYLHHFDNLTEFVTHWMPLPEPPKE